MSTKPTDTSQIVITLKSTLTDEKTDTWTAKVHIDTGGADGSTLSCAAACLTSLAVRRRGVGLEEGLEEITQKALDYIRLMKEVK